MKLSALLRIAMLLAVLVIFYLGASRTLLERSGTGEAYPRFSTYRNDPQGFRVLYEALQRLPGIEVIRNQRQLSFFPVDQAGALIISDAVSSPDPVAVIERIEAFVEQGGRLIIAYAPLLAGSSPESLESDEPRSDEPDEDADSEASKEEAESSEETLGDEESLEAEIDREFQLMNLVDVEERWGVEVEVLPADIQDDDSRAQYEMARDATPKEVFAAREETHPSLPWRSARYFSGDDDVWTVWYEYASGEAAIVERRLGAGSIVLLGDSYLLSNESLAEAPIAPFLARLVGPHTRVIFDEWTKGVRDDPWLIDLVRRYRLDGVLAALAITALLIVWRSALPLPPRPSTERRARDIAYRQEQEIPVGLSALIERNIATKDLPKVCLAEWEQTFQHDRRYDQQFRDQLRAVLCHDGPETPLERYRAASMLIEERKHYRD